jgi:predicted amino acid-binding ACT domain protein
MVARINEFASEQRQALAVQVQKFREQPIESMREVAMTSADGIKSLKAPVRAFAHSGVKLTAVSQNAMRDLIELESEVVTSALTAAALRLERAVEAENVVYLVLEQAEMLGATRDRIVDEMTRAVEIFRVAGREVRKVGTHLYDQVFERAEEAPVKAKSTRARKAKSAVRKSTARVRKAAA